MQDENKTKSQLLSELAELRQRVAELEALENGHLPAAEKLHREALKTSETRYRRLFETAQDGILLLDVDTGQIIDVNPFLTKLLGYPRADLVRKALWEIGPFKNVEASRTAFAELQSKEYIRYEDLPLETSEGRRIDVEFVSNVYLVDHKRVIQCNIRDITARKQAEAQLQDYQCRLEAQNLELRKLSLAIEQSGNTIIITDTDGAIQYANPRFEETTGYTLGEALGQNPRILKSGEQNADYYRVLWDTITNGQIWHGELHNRRKDGTLYWESATIAPVNDAAGRITHYIAIKEDVTERKQAQQALRQYADQLAAQNAELDAFAHTVAHDLKNPIGVITGFAEVLTGDWETMLPKELSDALRIILRMGRKLDTIVEELMLLTGVRKQAVTPQPLDMNRVVRESIERLQILIQDQHAHITLLNEAAWPVALGYAPWVEEVWVNYISNAIKYGGQLPQVEVGADPLPNPPSPARDGREEVARFWVRDSGPGLSAEAQIDLFTPFTRLGRVCANGHGLGLSIVQRIVEKLGGQVGVESKLGQGSTFFFTLPTRDGHSPELVLI